MKYLSGDFLAEYSRALEEYKKEQEISDIKAGITPQQRGGVISQPKKATFTSLLLFHLV